MNLQFFLEKLENNEEFNKFLDENKDAFLCSGFFIIDLEGQSDNKYHLDYFIPSKNQMISFQLEKEIKQVPVEMLETTAPQKISEFSKLDFEEIKTMISTEMELNKINKSMQKIILSLQNADSKNVWLCTVFISGMGLLKVVIDDSEKKITHFERKSFSDFFKKA
ncbi:MAG: hypothetical protein KKA64_02655 [Nanoarchaeota archaeon]|nr:hypothetical protein [Nanoarchaeota archaeon]